jgi:protein O-mannosyl-transferase
VAELADALDLGSSGRKVVQVQLLSSPFACRCCVCSRFFAKSVSQSNSSLKTKLPDRPPLVCDCVPPTWVAVTILALSIGIVYVGALRTPFIFDDQPAVVQNISIVQLWPLVGGDRPGPLNPPAETPVQSRPLANLSLAINYFFGGLNPAGYHAFNIVVHLLSSILLWAIVRRALLLPYFAGRFRTSAGWMALVIAILWALHPLQTEAVAYVTQRTELMFAFFYLATLYCSLRYWNANVQTPAQEDRSRMPNSESAAGRRPLWVIPAVLACLCGMGSKEVMVSAPVIVLLFERTFVSGSFVNSLRRSWPLYAGLAATWTLLIALTLGSSRGHSAGFGLGASAHDWWLTQSKVALLYLKLVVWPWPLQIHYELPYLTTFAQAWMYAVPVLLLICAMLVELWRNRPVGFLGIWIIAILSPTFVVPIISEMAAERRMYLPLAGLITLFVCSATYFIQFARRYFAGSRDQVEPSRPVQAVAFAVVVTLVIVFGSISAKRVYAYRDEAQLWREVLEHQPQNFRARYGLGFLYLQAGQLPEAIGELRACLALNPNNPRARNDLGLALVQTGHNSEAVEQWEKALQLKPDFVDARNNLGNFLLHNGRIPESIEQFRLALDVNPNDANANYNYGDVFADNGHWAEAMALYERAIRSRPNFTQAHDHLAYVLWQAGETEKSIAQYEIALQLNARHLPTCANLMHAYALTNQPDKAIAAARRAIEIADSNQKQEEAQQLQNWLTHYEAALRGGADVRSMIPPPSPAY